MSTVHVPILVKPIVDALVEGAKKLGEGWIVDCTLGGGGNTAALLARLEKEGLSKKVKVLSLDQDERAVENARQRFAAELKAGRLEVAHSRFSELEAVLNGRSMIGVMADLGFSSDQMDDPERGLSFNSEGPLDMRLDPARGQSCAQLLAKITEFELEQILSEYGEERYSRRIASEILSARRSKKMPKTPKELAALITKAVPPFARHGRIHAATRSFQALRIAVNDELGELDALLDRGILSLRPGGRVAILSFHSLEDGRVKRVLKGKESPFLALTKKPIEPDEDEIGKNPRARSAKLRISERVA